MIDSMRTIIASIIVVFSLVASPALAQFGTNSFTSPQKEIELKPSYPQPGEEVTATLNDYSGGAYGSSITWLFNGKEVNDATNQRQVILTTDINGKTQTITVVLNKPDGTKEVLEKVIKPKYLDIILEPQTRVPDFYDGRSLPSIGSQVNATAIIDGQLGSSNLLYLWRLDQTVLQGGPLRGGNRVSFTTPRGNQVILSLHVTELNGAVVASRSIMLPIVRPEIKFYEISTLFGIKKRAASSLSLIGNSATIKAEPYYLDSRVYNFPDIKEWYINKDIVDDVGNNPYEVTIQRLGDTGVSNLRFHVRDTKQVLQGADATMKINF